MADTLAQALSECVTVATNDILNIDVESRTITMPSKEVLFGVESDECAERKYFKAYRYVGNDLDLYNMSIRINYKNANGETDQYIVTDKVLDGDYVIFSWELSRKVTKYKGTINFIVCAVISLTDGTISNEWHTELAAGKVLEGLEARQVITKPVYDLAEQLLNLLQVEADEGVQAIEAKTSEGVQAVENSYNEFALKVDAPLIRETVSGEDIVITDSAHCVFTELAVSGKSEQDTTTGAQLVDIADFELVKPDTRTKSFNIGLLSAGTYHINIELSGTSTWVSVKTQYVDDSGTVVNDTDYIALVNGDNVLTSSYDFNRLYFFIDRTQEDGVTASIKNVMFSVEALPYEKYTGGVPAPNSDYPQEIKSALVSKILTHGKNELDCRGLSELVSAGFTFTPVYKDESKEELLYINVNGTWDTSSTATNVRMKLGVWYPKETGDYVLSGMTYLGANSWLCLDKNGDSGGYEVTATTSRNFTVVEDAEFYDVWLRIESGLTVNNAKIYPMIRRADITDDTYEPYTETVATLSNPIELGGIGDVEDVLDAKGIKRRFAYTRVTRSNVDAIVESADYGHYFILNNVGKAEGKCISTHFIGIAYADRTFNTDTYRCFIDNMQRVILRIPVAENDNYSDVEAMRAYLDANEVYVVYELAEPTTEELPVPDQEALSNLTSFYHVTHVSTDSEVKPVIEVEYVADTKLYIDNKIAAALQ